MSGRKLGRGLDALIRRSGDSSVVADSPGAGAGPGGIGVVLIDPARIRANQAQPRTHFDEEGLDELARSLSCDGMLQPLVVRNDGKGGFELVAG
ncbi:MAG: ParB N-terminal domain-containing protein, partial [Planctomycetota bacterium]